MAFGNIGLQEPSTITARVATVTISRGSTAEQQEILVLGDVTDSNAVGRVLGSAPASTDLWVPAWADTAGAQVVTHGRSLQSTFSTNIFASSNFTFGSTTTGQSIKVYAYSITSTVTSAQEIKFYGGSTAIWAVVLQAQSGGVSGVNLSVTPPAYLFKSDAGSSMTVNLASSLAGFKGSISYFVDPLP